MIIEFESLTRYFEEKYFLTLKLQLVRNRIPVNESCRIRDVNNDCSEHNMGSGFKTYTHEKIYDGVHFRFWPARSDLHFVHSQCDGCFIYIHFRSSLYIFIYIFIQEQNIYTTRTAVNEGVPCTPLCRYASETADRVCPAHLETDRRAVSRKPAQLCSVGDT